MIGRTTRLLLGSVILVAATGPQPALRDGAGVERALPRPAIALFWAAWCAPCQAELRNLVALKDAAGDVPVIIVALDGSAKSHAILRGVGAENVRYPARADVDVMTLLPEGSPGVPAAFAIDGEGAICATKSGGVSPADLTAWRKSCAK